MSSQPSAVITGANSGFGRKTAELLASRGWRVFATMRDVAGRNAGSASDLRAAGLTVVELDVTSDASVHAAAAAILAEIEAPDVLVNNAGAAFFGIQEAFTPAAVERQYAINVVGPLRVNRAFLPAMRGRRRGLIVWVSSVVGRFVLPFGSIYQSSKWAVEALAEVSKHELAPLGIDVAIVEPGAYPTEIFGKVSGPDDPDRIAAYGDFAEQVRAAMDERLTASSQGRDPGEVAAAIVALAEAAPGTRPLRTPVPAEGPAVAINATTAPIQAQILAAFGLAEAAAG